MPNTHETVCGIEYRAAVRSKRGLGIPQYMVIYCVLSFPRIVSIFTPNIGKPGGRVPLLRFKEKRRPIACRKTQIAAGTLGCGKIKGVRIQADKQREIVYVAGNAGS